MRCIKIFSLSSHPIHFIFNIMSSTNTTIHSNIRSFCGKNSCKWKRKSINWSHIKYSFLLAFCHLNTMVIKRWHVMMEMSGHSCIKQGTQTLGNEGKIQLLFHGFYEMFFHEQWGWRIKIITIIISRVEKISSIIWNWPALHCFSTVEK